MRLVAARIQKYRCIRDTGWFDIEPAKSILVGANEAGKTAILQALQQLRAPAGVAGFDSLRDYPRSEYGDFTVSRADPESVDVVSARFRLDSLDIAELPPGYEDATYVCGRRLDNSWWHRIDGGPERLAYTADLDEALGDLAAHVDGQHAAAAQGEPDREREPEREPDREPDREPEPAEPGQPEPDGEPEPEDALPSGALAAVTSGWTEDAVLTVEMATSLRAWLDQVAPLLDESNAAEKERYDRLLAVTELPAIHEQALSTLADLVPVFIMFSNYIRVRPLIHLGHLATRLESDVLDDDQYDYGNACLMKLLGFSARELSDLGRVAEPAAQDTEGLKRYRDQLDRRAYQLNAASVRLTNEIRRVWSPNPDRPEADRLRVIADGQYLKVVVEDELGVEIELDQRSEGFQWLVSFFTVFFAESAGKHANAILLLDEPGLSLHGLKQRSFRSTLSRLASRSQTIFTTHSPFLVGPDELDIVRLVEMTDRTSGTKVHTTIKAADPVSVVPLQESLGYDLAQSMFTEHRNLVLERLSDYWYVEATAHLLAEAAIVRMHDEIAMHSAGAAGKVVYYATILHASKLKVAALLDSDAAGDNAAKQERLVRSLGHKNVLRTKDAYTGTATKPVIEDMLRETLINVAASDPGWDVRVAAASRPDRSIVDIFADEVASFSRYELAKAYVRWTRAHKADDLTVAEQVQWENLVDLINAALE
jgi:predicted ATPase